MGANNNLHKAKKEKNDEFYTQSPDIEREVKHYKAHFKGKVVFLNCDDPEWSNFWSFFIAKFEDYGLKKLIATHYEDSKPSYKLEVTGDLNGDGVIDGDDLVKTTLKQNGDFRSSESIELLKEADIVVTNPPFSLFREYIAQLIEYDKKFLIVGNMNAITYKEIFPLIKDNKIWVGYGFNLSMVYGSPYGNNLEANRKFVKAKGYDPDKHIKVPAISWYTNLPHSKRTEDLKLVLTFNEENYLKYDNYDAINIDKVAEIPKDYDGVMGVPITFLGKYNPEQFEIIDANGVRNNPNTPYKSHGLIKDKDGTVNKQAKYVRILIQNKELQ